MPTSVCKYVVDLASAGLRLDVFLAQKETGLSRSQIKKSADEGLVLVQGAAAKAGLKLKTGDAVDIYRLAARDCDAGPEDIPIDIVYEDRDILVINKPAGIVVHPAAGHNSGTIVNAVLHHCRDLSGIGGVLRPGIVHRLDKDTSGLLVIAKSDESHRGLVEQFKARTILKTYKALVLGDVRNDEGVIDASVGRHPVDRKRMSTESRWGKPAVSRWRVCERFGAATLLDVTIETGRTHQIRVHLSSMGYPVIGDSIYGGAKKVNALDDHALKTRLKAMKRQALHAERIEFLHPVNGRPLAFLARLPADIEELTDFFRRCYSSR